MQVLDALREYASAFEDMAEILHDQLGVRGKKTAASEPSFACC